MAIYYKMCLYSREFYGKTDIMAWLLMTITKDWSTHSESLVLQVSSMWSISLMNDYACHNANKDRDQNTDNTYDQRDNNVGT